MSDDDRGEYNQDFFSFLKQKTGVAKREFEGTYKADPQLRDKVEQLAKSLRATESRDNNSYVECLFRSIDAQIPIRETLQKIIKKVDDFMARASH